MCVSPYRKKVRPMYCSICGEVIEYGHTCKTYPDPGTEAALLAGDPRIPGVDEQ